MKRVMIQADEALLKRARRVAASRGVSMAQLVRDAIERELGSPVQPTPLSLGAFRSGRDDLSRLADEDAYRPDPWRSS